jgi:phosphoesterase RecJ-like protein
VVPFPQQTVAEFQKQLKNTRNAIIFTHVNPDGDAIGSALALVAQFKQREINTHVLIPNRVPENLRWLPNFDTVREGLTKTEVQSMVEASDMVICVDFNHSGRVEKYAPVIDYCKKPVVLIDHHANPQIKANMAFSYIETSSTCELIHHLFALLPDFKADVDFATCIYVGIITDTGMFSYSSGYVETFETVIDLLKLGINKDKITQNIYNTLSESRLRFLGYALNERMVVMHEIHTAYIFLTANDQKKFNYQPGDAENFVNYPLSINGIRFTALFQERENDIKISFRSEGDFAVNTFATKHFNGGGHKNAAGGKSHQPLEKTLRDFEELAKNYAHEI